MPMVVPEPLRYLTEACSDYCNRKLISPIACNGDTSTVTISATGGTAPYTGTGIFRNQWKVVYTVTDANVVRNRYVYSY